METNRDSLEPMNIPVYILVAVGRAKGLDGERHIISRKAFRSPKDAEEHISWFRKKTIDPDENVIDLTSLDDKEEIKIYIAKLELQH